MSVRKDREMKEKGKSARNARFAAVGRFENATARFGKIAASTGLKWRYKNLVEEDDEQDGKA